MQLKVRALVFLIAGLLVLTIIACNKDSETTIVNTGFEVEEFEADKLNAYPIIGYMQSGSVTYPVLDGDARDEIWTLTEPYQVQTTADANGFAPTVTLKALYDNYYLFLLATWEDTTESFRKDMWWLGKPDNGDTTYADRKDYTWHQISSPFKAYLGTVDKVLIDTTVVPPDTQYVYAYEQIEISGDEDALAIMWNVNSNNFLNCANLCHGGSSMSTDTDEMADVWFWSAARTNPKKYADDRSLQDTGFANDQGDPCFKPNENEGEPAFANVLDPGSNRSFLYDSTATKYYSTLEWRGGNRIAGYILSWPSGSRADIRAVGKYKEGSWTVEIRRRLDTMVEDGTDIIFNPDTEANIAFHLAIYDNAHGDNHAISSDTHLLHFLQLKK